MNHSTLSAFAGAFTLNIAATTLLIAAGAAHGAVLPVDGQQLAVAGDVLVLHAILATGTICGL